VEWEKCAGSAGRVDDGPWTQAAGLAGGLLAATRGRLAQASSPHATRPPPGVHPSFSSRQDKLSFAQPAGTGTDAGVGRRAAMVDVAEAKCSAKCAKLGAALRGRTFAVDLTATGTRDNNALDKLLRCECKERGECK